MAWCDSNNLIRSESAHKASVPEDHKPKWESADRRAFVSEEFFMSIKSKIIEACRIELCTNDNPFGPISVKLIDYCPVRYYVDDAYTSFRETINVVFYGKLCNMYIIWLTRNFPTFDIFGCKQQFNDWTRYEIYIPENEMSEPVKVETRIRYEVEKFLETFMSVENETRKDEKEMGEQTHEEIVAKFKLWAMPTLEDKRFKHKKIIYSNGVTTILWEDGTKTTVRAAEGEVENPGAGIAYAFMKKALGNKNEHNKVLRKEVPAMLKAEKDRIKKKEQKKNGETVDS